MQILIVEDDQRLARQLKKGLDEIGHSVSLAFDGLDGLEAARQGHFDVLVLDVMLPRLDGFGVVRRSRSAGSKSPILILTARDSAEDIVAGLDVGADDYLTKPFALKVLLARLRALARRKDVEPQNATPDWQCRPRSRSSCCQARRLSCCSHADRIRSSGDAHPQLWTRRHPRPADPKLFGVT